MMADKETLGKCSRIYLKKNGESAISLWACDDETALTD